MDVQDVTEQSGSQMSPWNGGMNGELQGPPGPNSDVEADGDPPAAPPVAAAPDGPPRDEHQQKQAARTLGHWAEETPTASPAQAQTLPAGPTQAITPTKASGEEAVLAELRKAEVSPEAVLSLLRSMQPVGAGNDTAPLDQLLVQKLSGDARWRAQNIRRYGPETKWPPELRKDTKQIIDKARAAVVRGDTPETVADLLRPLTGNARHQCITLWRSTIRQKLPNYYDLVLKALDGKSYAPAPNQPATPPLLNLEGKSEAELYAYLKRVCEARGYSFKETQDPEKKGAQVEYTAINIRGYDRTTSKDPKDHKLTAKDYSGRMFLCWKDGKGTHCSNWQWSNTGTGATKLDTTHARGDRLLKDEAKIDGFEADARGKVSSKEQIGIDKGKDADAAQAQADQLTQQAQSGAQAANQQAQLAKQLSASRAQAKSCKTNAEEAMTAALNARKQAEMAQAYGRRAAQIRKKPYVKNEAAEQAKKLAEQTFEMARNAWVLARQQELSNSEEETRKAWEAVRDNPEATDKEKEDARKKYEAARTKNNNGLGENNSGQMAESNALPWLQEGQYTARLTGAKKGEMDYWVLDAGMDGEKGYSGNTPVDRDWNADGKIDEGETDVPGTAMGTAVLIHRGDTTRWSIGCQVAPQKEYGQFVDKLKQGGNLQKSYNYIVIDAQNMLPWEDSAGPGNQSGPTASPAAKT